MVLTWDHKDPAEYKKAAGKNTLTNYKAILFADVTVTSISKANGLFEITDLCGVAKPLHVHSKSSCICVHAHVGPGLHSQMQCRPTHWLT
jgi:hypothetical protein